MRSDAAREPIERIARDCFALRAHTPVGPCACAEAEAEEAPGDAKIGCVIHARHCSTRPEAEARSCDSGWRQWPIKRLNG